MNYIILILIFAVICFVIPINLLIILSVGGVILADTSILPRNFIYMARFVPIGIFAFRSLTSFLKQRTSDNNSYSLIKTWVPFLLLALISTVYSLEPSMTIQRVFSGIFVFVGLGIGIPYYFKDSQKLISLINIIAIIMGGIILYSFYSSLKYVSITSATERRIFGDVFGNANTLGILAMQVIFLLIYLWQNEKREFIRNILFLIIITVGVTIILSSSRASVVGFVAGLLVYIWANKRVQKKMFPVMLISILLLTGIYLIMGNFFPEYLRYIFRTSLSWRLGVLKCNWKLAMKSPYLGLGFGGTDQFFRKRASYLMIGEHNVLGPHNSFMKLLNELGFTGIFLVFAAFFKLIHRAIKYLPHFENRQLGITMMAVIAASLTNAFFEAWLFGFGSSAAFPFWLFFAILSHQTDQVAIKIPRLAHKYAVIPEAAVNKYITANG